MKKKYELIERHCLTRWVWDIIFPGWCFSISAIRHRHVNTQFMIGKNFGNLAKLLIVQTSFLSMCNVNPTYMIKYLFNRVFFSKSKIFILRFCVFIQESFTRKKNNFSSHVFFLFFLFFVCNGKQKKTRKL